MGIPPATATSRPEQLRSDFYVERLAVAATDLTALASFFSNLPDDPYLAQLGPCFRQRRLSAVWGPGHALRAARTSVQQAGDVNWLFPGVERTFEPLQDALVASPAFGRCVAAFRSAAGVSDETVLAVHALRTLALPGGGEPTPEGIHCDGYRVLGFFVVAREGLAAGCGVTSIYTSKSGGEPLFQGVMQAGDALLVNDRLCYHHVSAVQPAVPGVPGTRDVLVLVC